jgi:hypothetical protein
MVGAFLMPFPWRWRSPPERYTLRRGVTKTRVLVAFEDEYRTYREFMAGAIRTHRAHIEVVATGLGALEEEVTRFDPHLVISSQLNTVDPGGRPAWVELPPDPERLAEICLDSERSEVINPALEELFSVVDETERLSRTKHELGYC